MVYTSINKIKQKHIMRGLKFKRKTVRVIKFIKDLIWIHNYPNNAKTYNLPFKVKKKNSLSNKIY